MRVSRAELSRLREKIIPSYHYPVFTMDGGPLTEDQGRDLAEQRKVRHCHIKFEVEP